ncbi:MAG: extracellular solute-binding protein [Eisenbergiella massiliensis]
MGSFQYGSLCAEGALASLDDYIAKDNVDMTQFYAPAVDEMTSAGVVYGIPLTVDSRVLFYNKDLLDEAGVDPASITDWDSLRDAAIKLTKMGRRQAGSVRIFSEGCWSVQ